MSNFARSLGASMLLLAALAIPITASAAPNNGAHGSSQRKAYCANQLLDCQYAVDDTCKAHPEKGVFCEADGYAVCNTLDDRCLAKAATSGSINGSPGGLLHSPGN